MGAVSELCQQTESSRRSHAADQPLPRDLASFHRYHSGSTIVVCGCGASLKHLISPERFITIGVNDVGRLFHPDYLVVLNPRHQFRQDRFHYVETSRSRAIFTQLELGIQHPHIVRIRLGQRGGVDLTDPKVLHFTRNSPYLAMCLAMRMGAKRIGLIGVDFTDHHFFAQTGRHALTGELPQIEREYKALQESCIRHEIEVVNLSEESRLTAFPKMSPAEFSRAAVMPENCGPQTRGLKVFFVNYKFLSCGQVFSDGLSHAAQDLGLVHSKSDWNDPGLAEKVAQFSPDLLFVVHGRKFARFSGSRFKQYASAVWLLDEPYEVDDTRRFSRLFNTVFVNDAATVERHSNAHYLPVCYDPWEHRSLAGSPRKHAVGFVGGGNRLREEVLALLARRGLLSYVVGGPWQNADLNRLCLARNIPATETAQLYRETKIIINVFRTVHHYNCDKLPGTSLNPRVYEATACGSLAVTQDRPELSSLCPGMPVFQTAEDLASLLEQLLNDETKFELLRRTCAQRLAQHTYAERLRNALQVSLALEESKPPAPRTLTTFPSHSSDRLSPDHLRVDQQIEVVSTPVLPPALAEFWERLGTAATVSSDATVVLQSPRNDGPGTEEGLVSRTSYRNVSLSFEMFMDRNTSLVAKVHLVQPNDAQSNSYHLYSSGRQGYVARHHCVFGNLSLSPDVWVSLQFVYHNELILLRVNGQIVVSARDSALQEGHCFLGTKGGMVRLRSIEFRAATPEDACASLRPPPLHRVLFRGGFSSQPMVSIVTTVYDRLACLERCLSSVDALHFKDFEQIIVADCPPEPLPEALRALVERRDNCGKRLLANLENRSNNWGIAPAAAGLALARGKYVCFLSDDNGYTPGHFEPLLQVLETQPAIGFAYSSCLYDGRLILNHAVPRLGRIDLGQPLFRRELFGLHLNGTLPFHEGAWDWRMVEHFVRSGVRYRHVPNLSFIFRLEKYPHLFPASQ
jgi:Glycosyl transferase family 2/Glycosyl transferases group 1